MDCPLTNEGEKQTKESWRIPPTQKKSSSLYFTMSHIFTKITFFWAANFFVNIPSKIRIPQYNFGMVSKLWRITQQGIVNENNSIISLYSRSNAMNEWMNESLHMLIVKKYQIWVELRIVIQVYTIKGLHYWALTQFRYKSFNNCLEDEPRVGTLIRRSLMVSYIEEE